MRGSLYQEVVWVSLRRGGGGVWGGGGGGKQRHEETYQTKKSRVQAASMEGSEVETQKQLLQCTESRKAQRGEVPRTFTAACGCG